jgi:hypothetical protein
MDISYRKNRGEEYFAAVFLCPFAGGKQKGECMFEKMLVNPREKRYHNIINKEGCEFLVGSSRCTRNGFASN